MTQYYIDENNTKKEKKKKTGPTGLLSIILIALAVTFLGDIIGILPVIGLSALTDDGGWRFVLDSYFPFLGSFILMLVYMANWDRELYVTAIPASRGGLKGNTVKWLLLGLLFGFVINGFCALIAYLHGDLKFSVESFDVIYMAVALILVGIQSSTEELIFRCYVFQAVRRRYGLAMGVVVNSVFFALMHGANPGIGPLPILDLLLWGVFCSLIVHYFDGFWFVCMVHTAWNYTQNFLLGLPNSGLVSERSFLHLEAAKGSIFYDFDFGIEGGLTSVLEQAILIALILLWAKKSRQAAADDSGIR